MRKRNANIPMFGAGGQYSLAFSGNGLWVMGREFGTVFELSHGMLKDGCVNDECPF